jgi:hypothetical protein
LLASLHRCSSHQQVLRLGITILKCKALSNH